MTIDDEIRDEKLQYDINREAAKISGLKVGKYEYLTGEEILPPNQRQIIEQIWIFSFQEKLKKPTEKQVGAFKPLQLFNKKSELKQIEGIFPENVLNDLIINKFKEIIKLQVLLKQMICIINQKAEKFMTLLNICYLSFFKR